MEMDKIVNLDKEELVQQAHQSAEQIFRLRFQMKMGQNEGLKKLRELKKDIARIKTVQRQHELGIAMHAHEKPDAAETEAAPRRKTRKSAKKSARAKGSKSKRAPKKTSTRNTKRTSKVAGKAKSAGKTKVKAAKRGKANAKKGGS